MAFFTGRTGSLAVKDATGTKKTVAKVRDWSLETTVELLSTDTLGSSSNTFVPGIKGATGSATLMYYRLESGESATFHQFTEILRKVHKNSAITTADRIFIELNVGDDTADDIVCNAYITSATVSSGTGELTIVPINFTVDGELENAIAA